MKKEDCPDTFELIDDLLFFILFALLGASILFNIVTSNNTELTGSLRLLILGSLFVAVLNIIVAAKYYNKFGQDIKKIREWKIKSKEEDNE